MSEVHFSWATPSVQKAFLGTLEMSRWPLPGNRTELQKVSMFVAGVTVTPLQELLEKRILGQESVLNMPL